MITFPDKKTKIDFYKKPSQNPGKIGEDSFMRFEDNKTFNERVDDKRLGYIKHYMVNTAKYSESDVKILWPKMMVTLRGKK
eukprot:8326325-Karenia_brevis.AAC.1